MIQIEEILRLGACGSTNDEAFDYLERVPVCLLWTTEQKQGRGSRGRTWISPDGHHLAMTLAFNADNIPSPSDLCYPLLVGVAMFDVLQTLAPEANLLLKWPNDILLNDRKLAGILCESRWTQDHVRIALGIGVNLRAHTTLSGLPKGYASLEELPVALDPNTIVRTFADTFPSRLHHLNQASSLNKAWLMRAKLSADQPLRLQADGRVLRGRFMGLSQSGGLLLRDASGAVHAVDQTCDDFQILK